MKTQLYLKKLAVNKKERTSGGKSSKRAKSITFCCLCKYQYFIKGFIKMNFPLDNVLLHVQYVTLIRDQHEGEEWRSSRKEELKYYHICILFKRLSREILEVPYR